MKINVDAFELDGAGAKPPPKGFAQNQLGAWETVLDDNSRDVHLYPLWGRRHDLRHGVDCWCRPFRDHVVPAVIVHFDPSN